MKWVIPIGVAVVLRAILVVLLEHEYEVINEHQNAKALHQPHSKVEIELLHLNLSLHIVQGYGLMR